MGALVLVFGVYDGDIGMLLMMSESLTGKVFLALPGRAELTLLLFGTFIVTRSSPLASLRVIYTFCFFYVSILVGGLGFAI